MGQVEPNIEDGARSGFVRVPGRIEGLPPSLRGRQALKGNVPVPAEPETTAPSGGFANDNNGNVDLNSYKAGDELPDGTIYVGKRQDGQHVVTTPKVLPRMAKHKTALEAHKLMLGQDVSDHGHNDWILPDQEEGKMLYEAKDKGEFKGTYEEFEFTHGYRTVWLSEGHTDNSVFAWTQSFVDGVQFKILSDRDYLVRPVRRIPNPKP